MNYDIDYEPDETIIFNYEQDETTTKVDVDYIVSKIDETPFEIAENKFEDKYRVHVNNINRLFIKYCADNEPFMYSNIYTRKLNLMTFMKDNAEDYKNIYEDILDSDPKLMVYHEYITNKYSNNKQNKSKHK